MNEFGIMCQQVPKTQTPPRPENFWMTDDAPSCSPSPDKNVGFFCPHTWVHLYNTQGLEFHKLGIMCYQMAETPPPARQFLTKDNAPTPVHSPAKKVWWTHTDMA